MSKNKTVIEVFKEVVIYFGSQVKTAAALGVTQQFISKVLCGKCDLPIIIAFKIEKLTKKRFTTTMLMSEKKKCYLKTTLPTQD